MGEMTFRKFYIGFHVTKSVCRAIDKEAFKAGKPRSKWLFLELLALLRARGYEVSDIE